MNYYIKLNDFKSSMMYYRWFSKNFPDDMGVPVFLFEWCITLFKNGKIKEAEKCIALKKVDHKKSSKSID